MKKILISVAVLIVASAVGVFLYAPTYLESTTNVVEAHTPYEITSEAQLLHNTLQVADLHSDTLLWSRNPLDRSDVGHVDVPRLVEGNVTLQVFSVVTKVPVGLNYDSNTGENDRLTQLVIVQGWPTDTWHDLLARALYQAERLHNAEKEDPTAIKVILSASDLDEVIARRASGDKIVGGLLATEGSHPLKGDLANIAVLREAGYRMMGLQHFFDNELGGSLHGLSRAGLTDFGKQAVREMERQGIIIDLAHSSPKVVDDTLDLVTRPVVVSHTGVKGICDTARNISDERMKRIAATGGIIGIGYWDAAVCKTTPGGVVASIRYAIDLLGEDHVALGSDYDGGTTVKFDTSELAVLTQEMMNAGFTEGEIHKVMGGNTIRLLRDMLPAN